MKKVLFKFLRRQEQKERAIVALDLGTEVIKALIFTVEEKLTATGEVMGRRSILKGYAKVSHSAADIQNGAIADIGNVIENCQAAISQASQEAGLTPTEIVLGVSGEFIKGETSTLSHHRDNTDIKLNPTELGHIVHKLQWKAFEDVRKKLAIETGHPEIDVKLVSTTILDVKIDDYKVSNPLGFQGKKMTLSIFNSFAPISIHEALLNLTDELGLEPLGLIPGPYSLTRAVEVEQGSASGIFIDIGATTTDIAVVSKGQLLGTKMFGIGGRTFTKRLALELNISLEEAEKIKIAYTEDKLEQKSKKIVSSIMESDTKLWLEGVTHALSEYKCQELPYRIFLCGGGSKLPEIKKTLVSGDWYKKLHFQHAPQAEIIKPSDLSHLIDETQDDKIADDITILSLARLGIELASEESHMQKAVRKVIGIMKV